MIPVTELVPDWVNAPNHSVDHLTTDSRTAGQYSLFFNVFDQDEFASQALSQGALVVSERTIEAFSSDKLGQVNSCRSAAGKAADIFFGRPSEQLTVVGVTGTNGKTSTTHYLAQLLTGLGQRVGLLGTLGAGLWGQTLEETGFTTPDVIATHQHLSKFVSQNATHACMEVSSHGLDQERIAGVSMSTAVFLNITQDHLDYHGSMDSYADAKARLFALPGLNNIVINLDDDYADKILSQRNPDARVFSFGSAEVCDLRLLNATYDLDGIEALVCYEGLEHLVRLPLMGAFNLQNVLASIGACLCLGYQWGDISPLLADLNAVPGRMQRLKSPGFASTIIDYAHTPDALLKACEAAKLSQPQKLIVVFGCGGDRDQSKRPQMAKVSEQFADHIVITSDNPRFESAEAILDDIESGFSAEVQLTRITDRAAAIEFAVGLAGEQDLVLIAGKGHENYQDACGKRTPFSDADTVMQIMSALAKGEAQ